MTADYRFLVDNFERKELIVQKMYDDYLPLIRKKGRQFLRTLPAVELDDFLSEVYLKLFYYANWFNLKKIKPGKFYFHIFVSFSCSMTYDKFIKQNGSVVCSLDDEDIYITATHSEDALYNLKLQNFLDSLNEMQRLVFEARYEGKTTVDIQKALNLSYWLVTKHIREIQEKANVYF